MARYRVVDLPALSDEELRAHIRELSLHLVENWALYFTSTTPPTSSGAVSVKRFCAQQLGMTDADFVELLGGSSPATTEPIARIGGDCASGGAGRWSSGRAIARPSRCRYQVERPARAYVEAFGHRARTGVRHADAGRAA